jgi:hypothetical protein
VRLGVLRLHRGGGRASARELGLLCTQLDEILLIIVAAATLGNISPQSQTAVLGEEGEVLQIVLLQALIHVIDLHHVSDGQTHI